MKRVLCELHVPQMQVDNPPVLGTDTVNKDHLDATLAAQLGASLPFFSSNGSSDDIGLTVGNNLPFFNSDGSQDDIPMG